VRYQCGQPRRGEQRDGRQAVAGPMPPVGGPSRASIGGQQPRPRLKAKVTPVVRTPPPPVRRLSGGVPLAASSSTNGEVQQRTATPGPSSTASPRSRARRANRRPSSRSPAAADSSPRLARQRFSPRRSPSCSRIRNALAEVLAGRFKQAVVALDATPRWLKAVRLEHTAASVRRRRTRRPSGVQRAGRLSRSRASRWASASADRGRSPAPGRRRPGGRAARTPRTPGPTPRRPG